MHHFHPDHLSRQSTKTIAGVRIAGRRVSNRTFLHVLTATIHGSRKRTRDRPSSTPTFPNRLAAPKENRGRPRHAPTNRVLPDTARRRHQHTISHSTEDAKRPAPFPTNSVEFVGTARSNDSANVNARSLSLNPWMGDFVWSLT